jgi:hypothetical protein
MKISPKYLPIFTVIVNIYYLTIWLIVFNLFDSHVERVHRFKSFFPLNISINFLNLILVIFNILSLFFIVKNFKKTVWEYSILFITVLFLFYLLWQFL